MICRVDPSRSEWIHRFIGPARSELNATSCPSGDHSPRLSSRVVATSGCGAPATSRLRRHGQPPEIGVLVEGRVDETLPVGRDGDLDVLAGAGGELLAGPARRLRRRAGSRHTFIPPPGVGRVVEHPPVARPRRVDLPVHVAGDDGGRTRGDVGDGDIEPRAVDVLIRDALPVGRPARLHVCHRLRRVRRDLLRG